MIAKEQFLAAIKELRKTKKRSFDQTVDLIINLKEFDPKRDSVNISIMLPFAAKKCKICAFLEKSSIVFDYVITKIEFDRLTQKDLKKIIKGFDFCVASAKFMPVIASKFGRVLGPIGKMPDPKIGGTIAQENDIVMGKLADKLRKTIKIKTKEKSIKAAIGKESQQDEQLAANCVAIYDAVLAALPIKKENVKNVMLKLTMSAPIKVGK